METPIRAKRGRKLGGTNARACDYFVHTRSGVAVTLTARSPSEAERKAKNFCDKFGYEFTHIVKGPKS